MRSRKFREPGLGTPEAQRRYMSASWPWNHWRRPCLAKHDSSWNSANTCLAKGTKHSRLSSPILLLFTISICSWCSPLPSWNPTGPLEDKNMDISSATHSQESSVTQESSDTTLYIMSPEASVPKTSTTDTPTQAPPHPLNAAQPHRPHPQTSSFSEGKRRPEPPPPLEVIELPECLPPGQREQRKTLVDVCVRSLFLCLSRFPQHYKSLYRLAHLYTYSRTHKVRKHTHHTVNHFCAIEIQECKLACGPRQQK